MTDTKKQSAVRIGLDIGTSHIVLARRVEQEFEFRTQLNAFLTIPFSQLTENAFKKESIPHTVRVADILVYGNDAERFANLFHCETRRPMLKGALNPNEPDGPAVIRQILANLAGDTTRPGDKLCFSLPGPPLGTEDNLSYHESAVRQALSEFGYEVSTINEGLAVVYAELEETNYTGIGISCGGGLCNVCLAYLSLPVVSFSLPKGGDFVDTSAAAATGEVATRLRFFKEQGFQFDGDSGDKAQQALMVYYDELIDGLVDGMREAFSDATPKLDREVPLVLAGGSALPQGFRDRFEKALRTGDFPLCVSEVRLASNPLCATAKGALIAALAEA